METWVQTWGWRNWLALAGLALTIIALFVAVLSPERNHTALMLVIALAVLAQGSALVFRWTAKKAEPRVMPFSFETGHMIAQLSVTADSLSRAAHSMHDVTAQQSSGAREQADLLTRTNSLLTDFIDLSERVQEQARSLTATAKQATETSVSGGAAIQQAIQGMNQIRAQVSAIAGTILALAQYTQRIDDIIASVSEIATQSNLLALNASIEAARAGVHGRGFAVVADEVRSLSAGSTQAARQVRGILGEIQSAMKETIRATEAGLQGVDAGVTMTQQAESVMTQLAANITESYKSVNRIYEIIRQQVDGLEEIAIGVERIDRITQKNVHSTRAVASVAEDLTRLATDLQITVGVSGYSQATVEDNAQQNAKKDAGQADGDAQEHGAAQ